MTWFLGALTLNVKVYYRLQRYVFWANKHKNCLHKFDLLSRSKSDRHVNKNLYPNTFSCTPRRATAKSTQNKVCASDLWVDLTIYLNGIYIVSQKTSHLLVAITLRHGNGFWYFFGRNVTDKVRNHKTYYYAISDNLCFCTNWQNEETRKSHFHSTAVLVHCLNSTSCLIASIFLTQDLHARCCMTP